MGVRIDTLAGTVVNTGLIESNDPNGIGVVLIGGGGKVTNQAGGTIIGGSGVGFYGAVGTVINDGVIRATDTERAGVYSDTGGSVTNNATGTIGGGGGVVVLGGPGTVVNAGLIAGDNPDRYAVYLDSGGKITNQTGGTISGGIGLYNQPGTVVNAGRIQAGGTEAAAIFMKAGGRVTNQASGVVTGFSGIVAGGGGATIINAGMIAGVTTSASGVYLTDGGRVTNQSGGTISGRAGVRAEYGALTLVNAGAILGDAALTVGAGALLKAGGLVTNQAGGTISGRDGVAMTDVAGTLINAGLVRGTGTDPFAAAVLLSAGGIVTNQTGGTITGRTGLVMSDVGTLSNAGLIAATGTEAADTGVVMEAGGTITNLTGGTISGQDGIQFTAQAGTVVNAGLILGLGTGSRSAGLYLGAGGSVTNQSGGTISGVLGVYGYDAATITNQGVIAGSSGAGAGIGLRQGGAVTNAGGGTISGAAGVVFGGAATLSNRGTIIGSVGTAVSFAAGHANLLSLGRTGVFQGLVDGGNSAGSTVASTLELTAGGIGTLVGLGSQIVNFAQVTIDAGAVWEFASSSTITDGQTVTNDGSIVAPVTISTGTLINNAVGKVGHPTSTDTAIVGLVGGTINVVNAGSIQGRATVITAAGAGVVTNQASAVISGDSVIGISGAGTVVNAGFITGVEASQPGGIVRTLGIRLGSGVVENQVGGTIAATGAVQIAGAGTVANAGVIQGDNYYFGVRIGAGGSVTNDGSIFGGIGVQVTTGAGTVVNRASIGGGVGGSVGFGVKLGGGGSVTNEVGATISADSAVAISGGAGTVVNRSLIDARSTDNGVGVALAGGGQVTNETGATISSQAYGLTAGGTLSLVNAGLITGDSDGVLMGDGTVTNQAGGIILGPHFGLQGGNVTLDNAGSIQGGTISLGSGHVTNRSTGTLTSEYLYVTSGPGIISNAGTISAVIRMGGGGSITNAAGGVINGEIAIRGAAGTVVNAGSITNGSGTGVSFAAGFENRFVLLPGGATQGIVNGGNTIGSSIASTMQLGSAASAGTITGLGTQFINFSHTTIDLGANWFLTGANSIAAPGMITNLGTLTLDNASLTGGASLLNNGLVILDPSTLAIGDLTGTGTVEIDAGSTLSVGGTVVATETIDFLSSSGTLSLGTPTGFAGLIGGFGTGRFIDLPDDVIVQSGSILAGNTLEIVIAGGGVLDFRLDPTESFQFQSVVVSNDKITLTPPCFREGTLILTARGEIAVEALQIGDRVITAGGSGPAEQDVTWVGYRRVACASHPKPRAVWPIRVRRGAFARNVPTRDLWLSPDHAVFVGEVLIPIKHLVNGQTVVQTEVDAVTYYHVELSRHDVLLADGLPCESYLDSGDRASFENGGIVLRLHPEFGMQRWEAEGFAPLHVTGPIVDAERVRLQRRAAFVRRRSAEAMPEPGAAGSGRAGD